LKKLFSNKIFLLIIATLLVVAIIIFDSMPGKPLQSLTAPISAVVNPVQQMFSSAGGKISGFFSAISEGMALREENETLKKEIERLEFELTQSEEAVSRWEDLKNALNIRDKFEKFNFFSASVLTRESDEWFSIIRADSGTDDGIKMEENGSLAVVDVKSNLVGRVLSLDNTTTKILPILHEGFSVSAKVDTVNGIVVRVHGEALLKEKGLCKVDQIPLTGQLQVGDILVTSGTGGLFPPGIPIGEIVSIEKESELSSYATLRPFVNIAELNDVLIMTEKTEGTGNTSDETKDK